MIKIHFQGYSLFCPHKFPAIQGHDTLISKQADIDKSTYETCEASIHPLNLIQGSH